MKKVVNFGDLRVGDIFSISYTGSVEWRKSQMSQAMHIMYSSFILNSLSDDTLVFVEDWLYDRISE